ncbi:lectin-like domain-containing protein [Streptomyces mesophilus]|uniref:lectin-like domain-containing protein n=1 Tax=Streptomyces mesophilus TaxID=1775132 RepID=UPI00331D78F8
MTENGHRRGRKAGPLRARLSAPFGLATVVALGLSLAAPLSASAEEISSEPFTGASVDEAKWYGGPYTPGDPTGFACLTAAAGAEGPLKKCQKPVGEKAGEGALRLTTNSKKQNGYVISRKAIPARAGMKFSVDFAVYSPGRPGDPADGISLMLLDGTAEMPKKSGQNGAGLGYVGLEGGYLGVGLDVYGNFTSDDFDAAGGLNGRTPNSITVRGAAAVDNPMVATYKSTRLLAADGAKNRAEARRTAIVELSHEGVMKVSIDFHDGRPVREVIEPVDLDEIKGQPKVPDSLRIGIAASTGNSTAIHEVWNGKIESLDPNLSTSVLPKGPVNAGEPAEFELTTTNDKLAGPTTGEVVTTQTFPEGVKPVAASGDGWTCTIAGQTVTCKRPGTGADALKPGDSYPPVKVKTEVAADAKGDKNVTSQATTPGSPPKQPDTSSFTVTPAKDPALVVTTKPVGDVVGGAPAVYQIDVANKPDAGATNGEVKVVRTFPEGVKPINAVGEGWTCKIDGQTVTCTRPGTGSDVLNPGNSYPPISIGTQVDDDAKGPLEGSTEATSGGKGTGPVKDTTDVKPAPAKDPNLSVVTKPKGDVIAGKPAQFTIDVSNAPEAGPTTGRTTVSRTFPEGVTPVKAAGDGWQCAIVGRTVTCQHDGVIAPGKKAPTITIDTKVDAGATGQLEGWTDLSTPGDPNAGNRVFDTFVVKEDAGQLIDCGGWITSSTRAAQCEE